MASGRVDFALVEADSPLARSAVQRYFEELAVRFDEGFDVEAYLHSSIAAGSGPVVLATRDGETVACGALQPLGSAVGEIKRMWVAPEARGQGLGRRLLAELEGQARQLGWHLLRLDTNAGLTEAIALYEGSGYRAIARYNDNPYAHHWFEKPLGDTPRHGRTDV